MIAVKICGITDAPGFDAAVEHGADWIGFVFFAGSPRAITPAQAATLCGRHQGGPGRVGLLVRPTDRDIATCLERIRLDALQIYDSAARAASIRRQFGLPTWLACAVGSAADLPREASCDRLVIESRAPADAGRPGGNGTAFDWSLLRGWQPPCPWLLAGGLDADNVAGAIRQSAATAVDVSSGVESRTGVKDPARIAAFIGAARAAWEEGRQGLCP